MGPTVKEINEAVRQGKPVVCCYGASSAQYPRGKQARVAKARTNKDTSRSVQLLASGRWVSPRSVWIAKQQRRDG